MICTSIILRKITPSYTDYGAKSTDTVVETEVPILRLEKVKATEFYRANEQGFKPELRIVISTLNYSDQEELKYNGIIYSIIRKEEDIDEMTIIAERKLENV